MPHNESNTQPHNRGNATISFFDFSVRAWVGNWMLVALIVGLVAYGGFEYYQIGTELKETRSRLASTTKTYTLLAKRSQSLQRQNRQLSEQLQSAREENKEFEEQIEKIQEKIGTIERVQNTDEELLKKYSRIYFLNENYVPSDFEKIDEEYIYGDEEEHVHADMWPYLQDLLEAAEDDNITLRVISAYRSFNEQAGLNNSYTVTYGSGANQFSAEQGYSEHQLGTTVDFTTAEIGNEFERIDETKAYEWLQKNAYKHGFVLSYPKNNEYYQFEPWHWRFVGEELAEDLHDDNMHFYDMSQREIDSYLPELFN